MGRCDYKACVHGRLMEKMTSNQARRRSWKNSSRWRSGISLDSKILNSPGMVGSVESLGVSVVLL